MTGSAGGRVAESETHQILWSCFFEAGGCKITAGEIGGSRRPTVATVGATREPGTSSIDQDVPTPTTNPDPSLGAHVPRTATGARERSCPNRGLQDTPRANDEGGSGPRVARSKLVNRAGAITPGSANEKATEYCWTRRGPLRGDSPSWAPDPAETIG